MRGSRSYSTKDPESALTHPSLESYSTYFNIPTNTGQQRRQWLIFIIPQALATGPTGSCKKEEKEA